MAILTDAEIDPMFVVWWHTVGWLITSELATATMSPPAKNYNDCSIQLHTLRLFIGQLAGLEQISQVRWREFRQLISVATKRPATKQWRLNGGDQMPCFATTTTHLQTCAGIP